MATGVAWLSNILGVGISFAVAPALVTTPERFPLLLYGEGFLAAICFVVVLVHYPAGPKAPPSAVASAAASQEVTKSRQSFFRGMLACLKSPATVLIIVAAGISGGFSTAWSAMLQQIIPGYSATMIGYLGFAGILFVVGGGLLGGVIQGIFFHKKMKLLLMILWAVLLLCNTWFALSLPTAFKRSGAVIPGGLACLFISNIIGSFCVGAQSPLFYEMAAETSFPAPEAMSASILSFVWNGVAFILLLVADRIPSYWWNIMVLLSQIVCTALCVCAKVRYLRVEEAEAQAKNPN
jgi:hypothetical protein